MMAQEYSLPDIPSRYDTPEKRIDYLAGHFWKNFNPRTDSLCEQLMVDFLSVTSASSDCASKKAVRTYTRLVRRNPQLRPDGDLFVDKYLYDRRSPLFNEQLYVRFLKAQGGKRAEFLLEQIYKNRVGFPATDFQYFDKNGVKCRLSDNYNKYEFVLIVFYDKFCEKMTDYILFKNLDGKYMTLPECLEVKPIDVEDDGEANDIADSVAEAEADSAAEEKKEKIIYYVTDEQQQSQYIAMFKKAKMDAVMLTHNIDQPFVSQLESKNEGVKFMRIDADLTDSFTAKTSKKEQEEIATLTETIQGIFKKALKKETVNIKLEKIKNKKIASMITLSEESRRMQDMMKMYSMPGMDLGDMGKEGETLVLNYNHPLVKSLADKNDKNGELICEQLYDLARLQHAPLNAEEMAAFIQRSNDLLEIIAEK